MPRLSKKEKQYWAFFINPDTGRRTYHELCRRCCRECKQSFRMISIYCPVYISKRGKERKKMKNTNAESFRRKNGETPDDIRNRPGKADISAKSAPFHDTNQLSQTIKNAAV